MIKVKFRKIKIIRRWVLAAGFLAFATYPIIILPMINPEPFKEVQKITRKDIVQENIQPGNMKVWSDPFGRKKRREESTN